MGNINTPKTRLEQNKNLKKKPDDKTVDEIDAKFVQDVEIGNKAFTIKLNPELYRNIRIFCAANNIRISHVINTMIENYLQKGLKIEDFKKIEKESI